LRRDDRRSREEDFRGESGSRRHARRSRRRLGPDAARRRRPGSCRSGGPDPLAAADASGADAAIGNPPLAGPVAAMNKLSEANALAEAGDEEGCNEYLKQAEALLKKK
jgi:hypothetical protein